MSNKMTCLGCDSCTSKIADAYAEGRPCPYCGLPAEATTAMLTARKRGADEELIRRFQKAEIRAAEAEKEAYRLRRRLERLTELINSDLSSEDPLQW